MSESHFPQVPGSAFLSCVALIGSHPSPEKQKEIALMIRVYDEHDEK